MTLRNLQRHIESLPALLRGEPLAISGALQRTAPGHIITYLLVIVIGAGAFGAAVGSWRASEQALFTAIKFPLILLFTALGNGLINGMLAPLLGLNITWRQSFVLILMSFAIAAAILGGFSPLLLFLTWNIPPMDTSTTGIRSYYNLLLVIQALTIAFAGIVANLRLVQLLRQLSGNWGVAFSILVAWLAVNLLLGAQLSWNLRPFVGSPGLPVQFLRHDAFQGNFFEAIWSALKNIEFMPHPN